MVENVKITLLICLTCIASSVLVLSYGEYTHRYELIATQNNGIYIFDRKTTTLNKCENGKCDVIKANFLADPIQNRPALPQTQIIASNPNSTQITSNANVATTSQPVTGQSISPTTGAIDQVTNQAISGSVITQPMPVVGNSLPTLQDSLGNTGYAVTA